MVSWQDYLDSKFPEGALLEIKHGDPDTDLVFHVPRFFVLKDEPSPQVGYLMIEAPQLPAPHRLLNWRIVNGDPLVVKVEREDGTTLVISNALTDSDKTLMKSYLKRANPYA